MKHILALLAIVTAIGVTHCPQSAHCADSRDLMVSKVVGTGNSSGLVPSVSTAAHALIDKNNNILAKTYGGSFAFNVIPTIPTGKLAIESVTAITSATTISFAPTATSSAFTLTPAHTATINGVITNAVAGRTYSIVVTTSGTTSYTLTFGTAFKTTATLATGTSSAKVFVLTFVFDGTNFNEVSRTTAM